MARLNIEEKFWLDVMGVALSRKVDVDRLGGNALRFYRYDQEMYRLGKRISRAEFDELGFMPELFPMFARETPDGIEAAGADKHFSWILDESERGAIGGKKSAETRRKKYGTAQPAKDVTPKPAEANPKLLEATRSSAEAVEPSSSSSSSSSLSDLNPGSKSSLEQSRRESLPVENSSPPPPPAASPPPRTSSQNGNSGSSPSPSPRSASPPREERKPIYQSAEELKTGLGATKLAEWFVLYPDAKFIEAELKAVWQLYADRPKKIPGTRDAWISAVAYHLKGAWERRRNLAGINSLMDSINAPPSPNSGVKAAGVHAVLTGEERDALERGIGVPEVTA